MNIIRTQEWNHTSTAVTKKCSFQITLRLTGFFVTSSQRLLTDGKTSWSWNDLGCNFPVSEVEVFIFCIHLWILTAYELTFLYVGFMLYILNAQWKNNTISNSFHWKSCAYCKIGLYRRIFLNEHCKALLRLSRRVLGELLVEFHGSVELFLRGVIIHIGHGAVKKNLGEW